jgi:hypothetical protein
MRIWNLELGMVVYACNLSTWEAEAGGFPVQGQPGLHSEFQDNLSYITSPYLKFKKERKKLGTSDTGP